MSLDCAMKSNRKLTCLQLIIPDWSLPRGPGAHLTLFTLFKSREGLIRLLQSSLNSPSFIHDSTSRIDWLIDSNFPHSTTGIKNRIAIEMSVMIMIIIIQTDSQSPFSQIANPPPSIRRIGYWPWNVSIFPSPTTTSINRIEGGITIMMMMII